MLQLATPTGLADLADLVIPEYSRRQIIEAGKTLRGTIADDATSIEGARETFQIAHRWREAHQVPMRHIRSAMSARISAAQIDGLTAARLKRMTSIRTKLARSKTSLLDMQDLGGCRAVVPDNSQVHLLAQTFGDRFRHELKRSKNYILEPKRDGYRSLHQVYRYHGEGEFAALNAKQIFIEVQLRTRLQHSWATALEAVATILGENLKAGVGNSSWLRFFALVSSEMAAAEGMPLVPGTPQDAKVRLEELRAVNRELNALQSLDQLREAVKAVASVRNKTSSAFLVSLDPDAWRVEVKPVGPGQAAIAYQSAERSKRRNSVLVEVDRAQDLRAAYPNYFLDVAAFTAFLRPRLKERVARWSNTEGLSRMLENAKFRLGPRPPGKGRR